MNKLISNCVVLAMLAGAVALAAYSPDWLSMAVVGLMALLLFVAALSGLTTVISFTGAFRTASKNVRRAQEAQPAAQWLVISKMESFFRQKHLDRVFEDYKKKVNVERKNGMIVSDLGDVINEDELGLKSWSGVMLQIPGTLTGLGLLGTFIGLITGIQSIQISSVEATLLSIQELLGSIEVAFYTSISGVILSIIFNIVYKTLWNIMLRDMGMFLSLFQRNVIPSVDEQRRYSQKMEVKEILECLRQLPRENFTLSNTAAMHQDTTGADTVLMPQIQNSLQREEFIFHLQPRFDLNSQRVLGAEALIRWEHPKLGLVMPSVFIPALEKNGYITKVDQYIWEKVCARIREWIDDGIRPVPITVNLSRTDILALDISELFGELLQKYRVPPKYIEFDIAQSAYLEAKDIVLDFEKKAQQKGFRVIVDGFRGDFFALRSGDELPSADAYKLDLRSFGEMQDVEPIIDQASRFGVSLVVEGIESTRQISFLRKNGITEGQGYYLSKALSIEEFESLMNWG